MTCDNKRPGLTRRSFLAAGATAALAASMPRGASGNARPGRRPNVVLIMADDMGYETVGVYGGESYETPRLDELARTGMRFGQAHATPVCTPTRLKLMTGLYNSRNYAGFGVMPHETRTFGHLFREAGYATYIAGKWQLGGDLSAPQHFGFDEYCLWQMTRKGRDHVSRYPNPGLAINGDKVDFRDGEYGPDIVTDHINDFMERHRNEPFFVYYPMILPHFPFEPTPLSEDWDPASEGAPGKGDPAYFGDMVRYTDKMVGKVVDKLEELGLREDTLIIFTADNGTDRDVVSRANSRQIRGGKLTSKDTGTRVPLIANWPGVVPEGAANNDLICFTYFLPTLAEIAGISVPETVPLDGVSFAPVLRGENQALRPWLYMWWYRNNDPDGPGDEFARTHRYKLYCDGRFYDVEEDELEEHPIEPAQLNTEQREIRDQLRAIIERYTRPGFYSIED